MHRRHLLLTGALLLCTLAGCRGPATASERGAAFVLEYDVAGLDRAARNQVASLWRSRLLDAGGDPGDVTMELTDERLLVRVARAPSPETGDLESLRRVLERADHFELRIEATPADLVSGAERFDLQAEYESAREWLAQHPDADVRAYNALLHEQDPELARLDFFVQADERARLAALIVEEQPAWRFTAADLAKVDPSTDALGLPAVGFELRAQRVEDFAAFTREHKGQRLAVVLDGRILTFPVIQDELPGAGIINGGAGGQTHEEAAELVAKLRAALLLGRDVRFIDGRVER